MNHNNAPPYSPYAQPYAFPPSPVTYAPTQTPYSYAPSQERPQSQHQLQHQLQQQQQHQQQQQQQQQQRQQQRQQQQQQHPIPHYFQELSQRTPPNQLQNVTPTRRQQQLIADNVRNSPISVPPTPGNGPGAPPPESNSPPEPSYEVELLNALRRGSEVRAIGSNSARNNNANVDEDDDDEDRQVDKDNVDEPVYQLPPPPEAVYPNEIELEKAMHAWSLEHGYELVRRASKRNAAKQLYKRYFHCSKHGKVSSTAVRKEDRKRVNRTSNRINCPMSLAAVAVDPHDPTGNWQIRHRKTYHNHPAIDVVHLAGHRRRARNPAVEAAVDGLFALGTTVGDVLKFLQRTNPDGLFKRTDVANMKLKYKKYGTCAQRGDEQQPDSQAELSTTGQATACTACKAKKSKCNNARPICDVCTASKTPCYYGLTDAGGAAPPIDGCAPLEDMPMEGDVNDSAALTHLENTVPGLANAQNAAQASRVLAALNSFQAEHVRPLRLTLESSAVEILAASTCGNGESYKSAVPRPFSFGGDYATFKEAFMSAAMKENTSEVLSGAKREPLRPVAEEGEEVPIEEHNEYIKQLAIYKRRNDMLKAGLRETVTKGVWTRVQKYANASEAWSAIEALCMPRGSDLAFARFSDLHNVTLEGSGGHFDTYVFELTRLWEEFNQMAACHEVRRAPTASSQSATEALKCRTGGDGTFPEELLCFLFLKGLGPMYQGMAMNLTKKCNVGGYGSGERCSFMGLTMMVKKSLLEGDAVRHAIPR